jgi:hypothetical protein
MSTFHRLGSTVLLILASAALLLIAAMPAAGTARPDVPEPLRPTPACAGFADRLRAEGFSAPAAKNFGQAMRDDCHAIQVAATRRDARPDPRFALSTG